MILPPPNPDTIFAEVLQSFPEDLKETAREFKAFSRARKIKTPAQLFRAVLLFSGLDFSEREIAANLVLVDPTIGTLSDQAVHNRLKACEPWLKALLLQMNKQREIPPLPSGLRVVVIDASNITAPGQRSMTHRLHIAMDLISLQLIEVKVTDYKTGETLKNFSFAPGDVVICDRGYSKRDSAEAVIDAGGNIIVRYNAANFPVQDWDGNQINVADALADIKPGQLTTLPVQFQSKKGKTYQAWIHVYRLEGAQAKAARRRCEREAQRSRYRLRPETLFLAEFVMVLSSIPPEILNAETVLALYRCRWQVELLIKRWKSLLDFDQLRARATSPLSFVWLHGKLLYAALLEQRLRKRSPDKSNSIAQQRTTTHWRLWKMTQREVEPMITLSACWNETAWPAAIISLTERKRKRQLQSLPENVVRWLHRPIESLNNEFRTARLNQ
jgi:hypothetical protein